MEKKIEIDGFEISDRSSVFIIAELSANHNGSLDTARKTICAAKRAGADAIKLQTYTPDTITLNIRNDDFRISHGTIWDGKYLYDLYKEAYTPLDWHEELFRVSREEGLICFSTPFDTSSVDLLEELGTPAYKIASFEITDIPLIEYVASKGKPVIISLGIAGPDDIKLALDTCSSVGNSKVILLKCTSTYPSPPESINAIMIKDIALRYDVITGISDHTLGITVPVVATAFGAKVIEKHLILNRSLGGPDSSFSLDEEEFRAMTSAVRIAEKSIGVIDYSLNKEQVQGRNFSRSLYIAQNIKKGEKFTHSNIRSVRPGFGLHPKYLKQIIGKHAAKDLESGDEDAFGFS